MQKSNIRIKREKIGTVNIDPKRYLLIIYLLRGAPTKQGGKVDVFILLAYTKHEKKRSSHECCVLFNFGLFDAESSMIRLVEHERIHFFLST